MKLIDLEPRWVGMCDNAILVIGITFNSPTSGKRLGCLFATPIDPLKVMEVIGNPLDNPAFLANQKRWQRTGETFDTLTLKPSLDFSARLDWHGFITNGEVT